MQRLSTLGNAQIGKGPRHPSCPELSLVPALEELVSEYPFLAWDEGYFSFLCRYDDSGIYEPERNLMISIAGLSHLTIDIVGNGYPLVTRDGFFEFGDTEFTSGTIRDRKTAITVGFAFDTTGSLQRGVYKDVYDRRQPGRKPGYEWTCLNFVEWLSRMIDAKGQWG